MKVMMARSAARIKEMAFLAQLKTLDAIEGRSLSLLQRLLLVNDGTLTDALEAAFLEPITLRKIATDVSCDVKAPAELELAADRPVMTRLILLRGSASKRNYVFAESWIALDRLPSAMREELIESDTPIGRLWNDHQLETRKELLRFWRQPAGEIAGHLGIDRDAVLLARCYRVFLDRVPLMIIAEYFPSDLAI
jgi:chorismate-pyruvate lyase